MFIRFYNKCLMCDTVYYEPVKTGCTFPSKVCPDCKKYYDRARSLKDRADGYVDYKYIRHLLDEDECEYCGKKLRWEEREIEHKTPVSKNGNNDNSNLCISCHQCNVEKGEMSYDEYTAYLDSLEITASEVKTILDAFKKHELLQTEITEKTERDVEFKNKIIKDNSGKISGMRKECCYFDVRKKIIKTRLTEWGKSYNSFCKVVGRKQLEENESTEIISKVFVA